MKNEKINIYLEEKLEIKTVNTGGRLVVKLFENKPVQEKEKIELPKEKSDSKSKEANNDTIGGYWLMSENSQCFNEKETVYVVEVPVKYKHPDVVKPKKMEMKNLEDFETFEECKT
jgi:hypothetical protein